MCSIKCMAGLHLIIAVQNFADYINQMENKIHSNKMHLHMYKYLIGL